MSAKIHKMRVSRELLMKALAAAIREQSAGMADMECISMNAVLVAQSKGGASETFLLDTVEVELVHPLEKPKAAPERVFTPPTGRGKIRLATLEGVAL